VVRGCRGARPFVRSSPTPHARRPRRRLSFQRVTTRRRAARRGATRDATRDATRRDARRARAHAHAPTHCAQVEKEATAAKSGKAAKLQTQHERRQWMVQQMNLALSEVRKNDHHTTVVVWHARVRTAGRHYIT